MKKKYYKRSSVNIIEHGSHRVVRSDAVRRIFSYDGRIVGCKIVSEIFLSVVIA